MVGADHHGAKTALKPRLHALSGIFKQTRNNTISNCLLQSASALSTGEPLKAGGERENVVLTSHSALLEQAFLSSRTLQKGPSSDHQSTSLSPQLSPRPPRQRRAITRHDTSRPCLASQHSRSDQARQSVTPVTAYSNSTVVPVVLSFPAVIAPSPPSKAGVGHCIHPSSTFRRFRKANGKGPRWSAFNKPFQRCGLPPGSYNIPVSVALSESITQFTPEFQGEITTALSQPQVSPLRR